jgi:hypothetical protein
MPRHQATTAADGLGKRLPTVLADLWLDHHDLVHLFDIFAVVYVNEPLLC